MSFQNLADIHAAGNAQRVENNVNGSAVSKKRHILLSQNRTDNALIAVSPRHLIADGDLALLSNVNANLLINARRHVVIKVASKNVDGNDLSGFAVRNAQGSIANFASLFAKNSAKQTFFSSQFGFALRSDFANENVACAHVGADGDNAVGIEIGKRILSYVGNVASNFFGSELGVASVALVFLNVHGSENVALD